MILFLRKIYYKIFIILLSMRKTIFSFNLGEEVIYNGIICRLHQGVNKPYWTLGIDKTAYCQVADEKDFRKHWTIQNIFLTYKSIYRFYMKNWFLIWVNSGIEDWCKNCDIW